MSSNTTAIGHQWKYYDLNAAAYQVVKKRPYFIRDATGTNYRLRFTGFYDDAGNGGAVTFEYLPL
ncbi:MAG: HmuY family protein [Owenweeksia sp.]|nr:HmuY family protein [Owenweeksia sp.]